MTSLKQFLLQLILIWSRIAPLLFKNSRVLLPFCRFLVSGGRQIVVFGGHGGEAFDDNSRALALHYSRDPGYRVYWVYKSTSVRNLTLANGLRPLRRFSVRAELIVALSHLVFYSHGFSDVSGPQLTEVPSRKVIYLGHGVWGLKRIERRAQSEGTKQFDFTLTVSDTERKLKSEVLGVPQSRVLPLGIPKHDALFLKRGEPRPPGIRTVIYSPTWRDWLQHKPSDVAIERHFSGLTRLASSMPDFDGDGEPFKVIYLLHKNIRGLRERAEKLCEESGFECRSSSEVDVNELLRSADYLITDYSALFWDFIVQGKPASRFVFDEAIYQALIGSYPAIEQASRAVTTDQPAQAWDMLFGADGQAACKRLADEVIHYSRGRSCERISIALDRVVRDPSASLDFPSRENH